MSCQKTIMVVDDNLDIVNIARAVLEREGHKVICACSGTEAFSQLEEQKPDLIVLDIMMPIMDGWEVLRRLKANPDTSSIPVMMLTVKGHDDDIQLAYEVGCDYYLIKPFDDKQMVEVVNRLLSQTR